MTGASSFALERRLGKQGMAVETALSVLRAGDRATLAPAIVIGGPHAFLREYIFDTVRRRMLRQGMQYRGFQVGGAGGFDAMLAELREADLFAPVRVVGCRVLRSHRGGGAESDGEEDSGAAASNSRAGAAAGEAALVAALEAMRGPGALIVVYERDSAPAKIRRAAEQVGLAINCPRPYDNQLPQFAEAFARVQDLRLGPGVAELLVARHAGDLSAIVNTLAKAAIHREAGATLGAADFGEPAAAKIPDLFELAEALSSGRGAAALAILGRALAAGRDPFELLAVEIAPVVRRMMLAAAMAAHKQSTPQIAAALGTSPSSPLAMRAIEGARRFGAARLRETYRRVAQLDADFKNGRVKEREEALAGMLLELMAQPARA
jgi:DNA polymerase III delta subunit